MTDDQLVLGIVRDVFRFEVVCHRCEQWIAWVPVDPAENWREAEAWC